MPTRSSLLVTAPSCLAAAAGSSPSVAGDHAQADRPGEDADLRDELVPEHRHRRGPAPRRPRRGRRSSQGGAGVDRRPVTPASGTVGVDVPRGSSMRSCACGFDRAAGAGARALCTAAQTSSRASAPGHSPYPEAGLRWPTGPMSMNRLPHASARARSRHRVAERVVACWPRRCWGTAAAARDGQPAVLLAARRARGTPAGSGRARSGGVARSAPRTGRSCCRAQWTVVSTPALWATMVTGRAGVLDDLVEVGHPAGEVALVPLERGNDDGVRAAWRRAASASGPRRARGGPAR